MASRGEKKEVTQLLRGSPGDRECRASHIRSLVTAHPGYVCIYAWILLGFFQHEAF